MTIPALTRKPLEMTNALADEIEQLEKEATPRPWPVTWDYKAINRSEPDGWYVAHATGKQSTAKKSDDAAWHKMMDRVTEHDAPLVATLRNHIPEILSALRSAEEVGREITRMIDSEEALKVSARKGRTRPDIHDAAIHAYAESALRQLRAALAPKETR